MSPACAQCALRQLRAGRHDNNHPMYAAASRAAVRATTSTICVRSARRSRVYSALPIVLRRTSVTMPSNTSTATPSAASTGRAGRSSKGGRGGGSGRGQQRQGSRSSSSNTGGRGRGGRGAAGRGEKGGRGRGGGSAGRSNHNHNKHKRSDRRDGGASHRPVQQFASDFSTMHAQCQAARYKVHAPGCGCSKMKAIRERVAPWKQPFGPSKQQDAEVHVQPTLDGLVVLPDIKSINSIYLCLDTNYNAFQSNPKDAELKLHDELFSTNESVDNDNDGGGQPYKVSCAQCLLRDKPNGFVCVSSPSIQTVGVARELAMKRIRYKKAEQIPLHSDHSEHVCVVSRKVLWQHETAKTRDQSNKADYLLRDILSKQGVENLVGESTNRCEVELGHHLSSLLHITKKDVDADSAYWLVMLQWTGTKYKVDLPGGKRHLGETSWEGAMRECEEECSLQIDSSWVHGEPRKSARKADEGNMYYTLRPPTESMMDSLESSAFWHEKGFCKEPVGVE